MASLLTVRQAIKKPECPFTEHRLRLMIAEGTCPGIYVGNRFMINFEALVKQVNEESVANLRKKTAK